MKKALVFAISGLIILAVGGCKNTVTPDDPAGLVGMWNATKAEFVSVANSSTKVDIITQGSTLTLELDASTYVLTITDPGENPEVTEGAWSATSDVLTLVLPGSSGEAQFNMSRSGDTLTLSGGHMLFDFTPGNPEEAILNLILIRQ